MELQARTQETKGHCAKGREVGSKASRTPKLPYQWTWELGGRSSRRDTCSVLIGAGERRLGVSVWLGWNKATRQYQQISARLKVEVDASANLFKTYLKHDLGLEEVSRGQEAALWAEEPFNQDQQPALR